MNPTVICGRMTGFGDGGVAVSIVYLDIKWLFYVVSHTIFVLKLGHGRGGQGNGGIVGLGGVVSAWRSVVGWSCGGSCQTCVWPVCQDLEKVMEGTFIEFGKDIQLGGLQGQGCHPEGPGEAEEMGARGKQWDSTAANAKSCLLERRASCRAPGPGGSEGQQCPRPHGEENAQEVEGRTHLPLLSTH